MALFTKMASRESWDGESTWIVQGRRLAAGENLDEMLDSMTHVAEGVYTTRAVNNHIKTTGIEMPIAEAVYKVLFEGLGPKDGVQSLMERSLKAE